MSSTDVTTPPTRTRTISAAALRVIFFFCLAAAVPVVAVLEKLNGALQNSVAPHGVMSFEVARTLDRQSQILASWGPSAHLCLAFSIGLDFFCAVAFLGVLALACLWLADVLRRRGAIGPKLGVGIAWALAIMGAFWMLQNVLLAASLFGHRAGLIAEVTYWCALLKFSVMAAALVYVALAAAMLLIRKQLRAAPASAK